MIILNPNHGSGGDLLKDDLSKCHVGLTISEPVLLVKVHLAGVVMEEWPQDGIGEAIVMAICDVIFQIDCLT